MCKQGKNVHTFASTKTEKQKRKDILIRPLALKFDLLWAKRTTEPGREITCANVFASWCQSRKGRGKRGQYCCGHIVADTNVSPFARPRNIRCGHKFCVRNTKNVSDFVQKYFVSVTNVSQLTQPKKYHEQQCVRNNVSSFAWALSNNRDLTQARSCRDTITPEFTILANSFGASLLKQSSRAPKLTWP